jgi:lysophosphatidylcholine acyltransferase/lyso-PAF acetyltransferase
LFGPAPRSLLTLSPAWESVTAPYHLFRFLTQFINRCAITLYPVYTPSAEEKKDPSLYAHNVRAYMAKMSGLRCSDSTLEASPFPHCLALLN